MLYSIVFLSSINMSNIFETKYIYFSNFNKNKSIDR